MAINFPPSPSLNQTYTYSSKAWYWNGQAWAASGTSTVSGVYLTPTDTSGSYYINFAAGTSGFQILNSDSDLSWNPSTNQLILASGAGILEALVDGGVF
jgi:hypothetical protein